MAEEIVVKELLSDKKIEAGKQLIQKLESRGIDVAGALWLFHAESSAWKLTLAFSHVSEKGARGFYERVQKAIDRLGNPEVSLGEVRVLDSGDPLIKALRHTIKTGSKDLTTIRLTRNMVDGRYIEDALVYRMK